MSDSKTIEGLRARLFDAIDRVSSGAMTIDQAKQVSELAQVVVNSAKVEVEFLKATGGGESSFINTAETDTPPALPNGITAITRHRLQG